MARSRGSGPPRRTVPKQPRKRSLLVFTEGQRTEPQYINHRYAAARDRVTITLGTHDQPTRIVDAAIEAKRAAASEQRRGEGRAYDEIWCVFDDDGRQGIDAIVQHAQQAGIYVAFSNPCIELWFLIHGVEQTAHITQRDAQRRAYELLGCEKVLDESALGVLDVRYDDALRRARALDRKHALDGSRPGSNPSTGMWRLTESICSGPTP